MAEQTRIIDICIMGRRCQLLEGLTILTAMEYSGYQKTLERQRNIIANEILQGAKV